jgi:hypothetical protein
MVPTGRTVVADDERDRLLGELDTINTALAGLGVAARVSAAVAALCDRDEDVARLVGLARRQWLDVLYQLGGTA